MAVGGYRHKRRSEAGWLELKPITTYIVARGLVGLLVTLPQAGVTKSSRTRKYVLRRSRV
jgi:hypothetical protein